MDFKTFQQAVAVAAAAVSVTDYELYYEAAESTEVEVFLHEVNGFSDSNEGGVCLRCLVDGRMGYASTQALTEAEAAALVRRAVDAAAVLENEDPEFLVSGRQCYEAVTTDTAPLPGAEQLTAAALAGQEALYAQAGVVDGCSTAAMAARTRLAIWNTRGLDLAYENTAAGMVLEAVVEGNGEKANDYKFRIAPLASIDGAAMAADAADAARTQLGAGVAPTGAMPVVFTPKAMSQLLGAFSGIFSAENAQKGLSLLKGKEGQTVAAACVTLVDDPFYPAAAMPMPFDAEGTPTHRKNVIEKGTLNTLLYNLKTAAAAGKTTTGNAAKAGYDAKVSVRPFTLYLAPGSATQDDLLAMAGEGVCIDSLGGLHAGANVISGDFSLQSSGWLIENGKKGAPVRSFTVAGNFFTLLQSIAAVANDVKEPTSLSPSAVIAPSTLVQGLTIAGK